METIQTYPDSKAETLDHIRKVSDNILNVVVELLYRANTHDATKLEEPEKSGFDRITGTLAGLEYGTDEYREALRLNKPTIEHHYANNSHHPEYYDNGINGMSLIDLVEMLCDWRAAGERMKKGGDIQKSLEVNVPRFGIDSQLESILRNTAKAMGWIE